MQYHPDCGGDEETMKAINGEFVEASKQLTGNHSENRDELKAYQKIVESLVHLTGLKIELCGTWLWVSGNTYEHKSELKTLGLRWSKNKSSWYWTPESYTGKSRGNVSMDEIRTKYGSKSIRDNNEIM